VSEENNRRETGFLNTPSSQPMRDRIPRKQTTILGGDARLRVKAGDKHTIIDVEDEMLVGRKVEGDDREEYALDLGPFGGYQSGVSRKHALITRHEGGLYIEDLGSTNGTRINGFQLTVKRKYRLRDGDEVEFARLKTVFIFIPVGEE